LRHEARQLISAATTGQNSWLWPRTIGYRGAGIQTHYIDPGSPWQNDYGESFNDKFQDECLNLE
jgi:transposase InsO family protein